MYETHFGFNKLPFSLSPDTELFVSLGNHEECFELLRYALDSGEGFVKIIGDVGIGKTIICRKLLRYVATEKASQFYCVYLPNPMLSYVGLYRLVGKELGLSRTEQGDSDDLLANISKRIIMLTEQHKSVVIVVDEAQSLPAQTLEALRLISNLETEQKKLVQIILFGQTELDTLLNEPRFRQLRQRIAFSHYLQPLSKDDLQRYLDHRIRQSGYRGYPLFSSNAVRALFSASAGIPRMVNVLAHKALLAAYADRLLQVNNKHIRQARLDGQPAVASQPYALLLAFVAGLMIIAALYWRLL